MASVSDKHGGRLSRVLSAQDLSRQHCVICPQCPHLFWDFTFLCMVSFSLARFYKFGQSLVFCPHCPDPGLFTVNMGAPLHAFQALLSHCHIVSVIETLFLLLSGLTQYCRVAALAPSAW